MWLHFVDITPCLPFLPPKCLLQYHLLLLEATLPLSQGKYRLYLLDCAGCLSLAVHYPLELGKALPLIVSEGAADLTEHLADIRHPRRSRRCVSCHALCVNILLLGLMRRVVLKPIQI